MIYGLELIADRIFNFLPQKAVDAGAETAMSDVFRMHGEKPAWDTEYTTLEVQQTGDSWEFRLLTHIELLRARLIIDQFVNTLFLNSKRTGGTVHLVDPLDQARDPDAREKPAVSRSPSTFTSYWIRVNDQSLSFPHGNTVGNKWGSHIFFARSSFEPISSVPAKSGSPTR